MILHSAHAWAQSSAAGPPDRSLRLWYDRPAAAWLEALPLGDGSLGAMVYGGVPSERIQLNDATLWSGGPKDCDNPEALKALPEIRQLIREGRFADAHQLGTKMMGPYTQTYLPMGDLTLDFAGQGDPRDYRRSLDLDTAVASTTYTANDVHFTREAFVSHVDRALVVRLAASRPGALTFAAKLGSRLRFHIRADDGALVLRGKAPAHVDPNYYDRPNPVVYADDEAGEGMNFEVRLKALSDGEVVVGDDGLKVIGATTATLILTAGTSYNGFDRSPGKAGVDPAPIAAGRLAKAAARPYDDLLRDHIQDHQSLFRRVAIDLGPAAPGPWRSRPTGGSSGSARRTPAWSPCTSSTAATS
ncbi:glycoside hydrolase N-terminal domain-containing protein [Planctomyces sp. SH-PL62]|uniref:glycoside hydrolase family 95 protein n=1 Tax=Planctomyces sp. SH-PL62 TaxID=1636152 RepID=UPI0018D2FF7F|nr:glycoside hydrolase family 95 protein [Planctomyces sp. SH-PL62]